MANNKLINVKHCKEYALQQVKKKRPGWHASRVSIQFLNELDAKIKLLINDAIWKHPSVGITIKDFF